MAWWQEFHFLRPYWLIALAVPVFFYLSAVSHRSGQSSWENVCDKNLLRFLLIKGDNRQRKWPVFLAYPIIVLMILALAGPTWIKKNNPSLTVENPVIYALNLSSDMWVKDVVPSRIVRAKYLITDLTSALKNTESGLLVYSHEPFVVTPLTEDAQIVDNLLPALELDIMPQNGDRLDRAIDLAVERMKEAMFNQGSIIVLTADVGERFDAALESAAKAAAVGYSVNVINMSAQENEKLQMIADKGQGLYLQYNQSPDTLIRKINDITAKKTAQSENMQTIWVDAGYYFLWLPVLLLAYYFRRGILVLFFVLSGVATAEAGWFLNDNQEALRAYNAGHYEQAAARFTDSRWQGAAAYKSGNYEAAYQAFAQKDDVVSQYNQGNALAKSGKIDEAIKKYEEVLKQTPDFEDARFNLEYLKKQKQQQQQQEQNQKNDQKQNQQQQNKQSSDDQQNGQQNEQRQNEQQPEQKNDDRQQNESEKNSLENQQQNQQEQSAGKQEQQNAQPQRQNAQSQPQNSEADAEPQNQNRPEQQTQAQNQNMESEQDKKEKKQQPVSTNDKEDGSENAQAASQFQEGEMSNEEMEKMRARVQKFREIPEDKGGLLRAFIRREYDKNRYRER